MQHNDLIMKSDKLKTCPNCNRNFECNHSANCWCSSILIQEDILNFLKRNFNDCLCEKCLHKLILKREKK